MLSNIVKGSHFSEALQYAKGKKQSQVLVKKISGRTIKQQVNSFKAVWDLRRRVQRPMFHVSLSLHHDDQQLDAVTWRKVIRRYLREMGYKYCPYMAIRHSDRDHDHVHIIASRITHDGQLVSDSWDYLKSQNVLRRIERDFQLTVCPSSSECYQRPPKIWEIQKNQDGLRKHLQNTVIETALNSPNLPEFTAKLAQKQINLLITDRGLRYQWTLQGYWDENGNAQPMSYTGSTLGKVFTKYGLKRYLLNQNQAPEALNPSSQQISSPWLSHEKAKNLYYQYAAKSENLSQTAQMAAQNNWHWEAIRFMLAQSQWFAYIKSKLGRRLALKALNVAIADGTNYAAVGMDYERSYVTQAFKEKGYEDYLVTIGLVPIELIPSEMDREIAEIQLNAQATAVKSPIPEKVLKKSQQRPIQPQQDFLGLG